MTDTGLNNEEKAKTEEFPPRPADTIDPIDITPDIEEEPVEKPLDQFNLSDPGVLQKFWANAASGRNTGLSLGAYDKNKAEIEEKKRKEDLHKAVLSTQERINADMGDYINKTFGKEMADLEKNWHSIPEEQREKRVDVMVDKSVKKRQELIKKHNGTPETKTDTEIKVTDQLAKTARENGQDNLAGRLETRALELRTQREIAQKASLTNAAVHLHGGQANEEQLNKAIKGLGIKLEEGATLDEKRMAIITNKPAIELASAQKLLKDMKDALKEFDLYGPLPESLHNTRAQLEKDIKAQEFTVALKTEIVNIVKAESPSWENASTDQITDDIINGLLQNKPELLYKIVEDKELRTKIIEAAKEAGIEDTSKIEKRLDGIEEAVKVTKGTIATMDKFEDRHEFLQSQFGIEKDDNYLTKAWKAFGNTDALKKHIKMQNDPVRDKNGEKVFSTEKGELYRMENGKDKIFYTDPLEIAQLRAQAWDPENPKLYTNETITGGQVEQVYKRSQAALKSTTLKMRARKDAGMPQEKEAPDTKEKFEGNIKQYDSDPNRTGLDNAISKNENKTPAPDTTPKQAPDTDPLRVETAAAPTI